MKKYIPVISTPNANELVVEVYYSLGGTNLFTYKTDPRGYYLSVSPFKRGETSMMYVLGSGAKILILPCNRRSNKREALAIELAKSKEADLIQNVLHKNNLRLDNNEEGKQVI